VYYTQYIVKYSESVLKIFKCCFSQFSPFSD